MPELIDISPPLTPKLAVFPGDTPMSRDVLLDMHDGANLTLSTLHSTVHLGAHADGPNHYGTDAASIDEMPLDHFIGPCHVIACDVRGRRVTLDDLDAACARRGMPIPPATERLLIATGSHPDPERWPTDFAGLDPAMVTELGARGIRTIGVDTPSVDPGEAKVLEAHHAFLAAGIAILEGLVLAHVDDGDYELIALPLRLVGFDASPVRAVLRTLGASTHRDRA